MNYIKIKTALLLLASASSLSATTADNTREPADLIFENFNAIDQIYKSMKSTSKKALDTKRSQISNFKAIIIDQINSDKNIINQTNPKLPNMTLLMHAAKHGFTDIINTLLNRGANIDAADRNGHTALMGAALYAQHGAIKLLLKHGADATIKSKKKQPL